MKFKIQKSILDETLDIVSRYSDSINSMYALRCIYIEITKEKIIFKASDGVISIIKKIDVDNVNVIVEKEGNCLIQANILKNVIKKLSGEVTLSLSYNSLKIVQNNFEYTLTTNPIDSFPNIEDSYNVTKFEINTEEFKKCVKNVAFATSNDNSLIYKCINLKFKGNTVRMAATDSYRLAYSKMNIQHNFIKEWDLSVIAKNVKDLIPSDAPEKVVMFYNNVKIGVEYKNTFIISQIIDLPFHEPESLINNMNIQYKIEIDKNEFLDLMNKVWFISNDKYNRLELTINKNEITMLNRIDEIGTSIAKTKNFKFDGKAFEMDLNYNFTKDALNVFNDNVFMLIDDKIQKILIISKSNENVKQLITPIRR
ncbi:DNA polymerase III subunit beta [Mycoplasmopsis lipofaciens]|uniref:DNA polymerase III subunit beta n=1 Tax=Mycoplasmopsis lipofaciens TaxID=114884 RepID=UPI00048027C5|nr:DNA polymerase III subunit beta [Mycoplasmopsis lipofaciens]